MTQVRGGLREPFLYPDGVGTIVTIGPPPLVDPDPLDSIGAVTGRRVIWSSPQGYEREADGSRVLYRVVSERRLGSALRTDGCDVPDYALSHLFVRISRDNEWSAYVEQHAAFRALSVAMRAVSDTATLRRLEAVMDRLREPLEQFWVPTTTLWLD